MNKNKILKQHLPQILVLTLFKSQKKPRFFTEAGPHYKNTQLKPFILCCLNNCVQNSKTYAILYFYRLLILQLEQIYIISINHST